MIQECEEGTLLNMDTLRCEECNKFCLSCEDTTGNCPSCLPGYFKDSSSTDCFDSCQDSTTYGNRLLEVCFENPETKVESPADAD